MTSVPWTLQVVVRVEKSQPPAHTDVLRAVGSAVAVALASFSAADADPEVRERTERWRSGPIRKVVRRARGAGWDRQLAVPGVFEHPAYGVDVAVHVPGPVDEVDPEISRLQVGGLTLADEGPVDRGRASARLWLNPHVALSTGKAAAQVGHGSQLLLESMPPSQAAAWVAKGAPLDVAVADKGDWDRLVTSAPVVVTDGGFTEVPRGTVTVVASYPDSPAQARDARWSSSEWSE